ncbi:MAG TPA: hypothetical protein VNU48_12995, partial [Burkholderiaceae bacterium]|nr:hypothetical protein [Burkholderiaceae bacterium]
GKSVDQAAVIDELRKAIDQTLSQLVDERVKSVVDDLPKPKDGESLDSAAVQEMINKAVELVKPKDGDPGRDALQIEPLPAVDVERAYPRGTWAMHAGGMVSSFRATTPGEVCEKHGWQVALNGIAEVAVDLAEDGRTVGVAMSMTDGNVLVKKLHFPVVLDKGVFNYEKEYAKGDGVTWGGSYWISLLDGLKGIEPRGSDTGWRLSIKTGQRGKSAYQSALDAGFTGTEFEWIKQLSPPDQPTVKL